MPGPPWTNETRLSKVVGLAVIFKNKLLLLVLIHHWAEQEEGVPVAAGVQLTGLHTLIFHLHSGVLSTPLEALPCPVCPHSGG